MAGGSGSRMGGGIPKQFRSLCGRPVLWWSIKAFHNEDPSTKLIIVLPNDFIDLWKDYYSTLPAEERIDHEVTSGGDSRSESVKNGLRLIDTEDSLVAVHDGARPLIQPETISRGWVTASKYGAGIPVVAVTDSIRQKGPGKESRSVNRDDYLAVQTPQVFKTLVLKESYEKAGNQPFTDDASVVENNGMSVSLFEGSPENIKITNPKDLAIAAVIMGKDA